MYIFLLNENLNFLDYNFEEFGQKNRKVTSDNFFEYLTEVAKSDFNIKPSGKYYGFIDAFKDFDFKNAFDMKEIQLLIQGSSVEDLDIERLIGKIEVEPVEDTDKEKQVKKQVVDWFMEILNDVEGKDFPLIDNEEGGDKIKLRKRFLSDLLLFWTGLRTISATTNLTVSVLDRGSLFLHSHTCYNTLELPINIPNKEELYIKMKESFKSAGKGLTQVGGGNRDVYNVDNIDKTLMGILGGLIFFL